MKISVLQEFLGKLRDSLTVVGIPPKSLDDLRAVAHALEPFQELELEQLFSFLKRAAEYRQTGTVPLVCIPALDQAADSTRRLTEDLVVLSQGNEAEATAVESRIKEGKYQLQTALSTLGKQFGFTVKFTDDKQWLPSLRLKGAAVRVAESIRRLAAQITAPESYRSEPVQRAIAELAAKDVKILKAAAMELGVAGKGTGPKWVESVLGQLTGIQNQPPKPAKKAKTTRPDVPAEQVETMIKRLQEMVARAKDPQSVPDSEIDALLLQVSREFSEAQQKQIAKQVTGASGRSAQDAIDRLRADLTAVKRLVESQDV